MMPFGFLFILISGLVFPCYACNRTDLDSLKLLSFTVSSPLNWSTSTDCCLWEGIACDQDGRVSQLQLPFRGLKGIISPFLGNLTHLSHLNLSHNLLFGALPDRLFMSLTRLSTLDLSFNSFFGEITSSLPFPSSIQRVDLSSNHLSGTILLPLLQQASSLVSFNVSNNSFVGLIPSSICSKSNHIKILDFSFNEFSDEIPHGLGGCSEMEVFRAGFNSLRGLLPYDIYNVPALREIFLPANHLNGPIDGVAELSKLTILDLSANELTGELPQNIGKLSNLEQLRLHINNLAGPLPPSLMNCSNLITLNLRVNFLKGDISALNFSKLRSLRKFDLGYNYLSGNLPESLFMCKSLVAVRLSSNNLVGQIPPSVSALQSLAFISLSNNSLTNITGAIKSLMGCKNLTVIILSRNFFQETLPNGPSIVNMNGFKNVKVLALGGCQFTSEFPTWIRSLKKLQVLDLSFNQLTGSIPGWLGTLHNLFYLDLSNNLFSELFVKELCTLKSLTSNETALQVKQFFLELPIVVHPHSGSSFLEYTSFSFLPPTINLRSNSLSGHIPAEIGQLKLLHVLDLSMNNFSGSIPDQISALIDLERLDLSENQLSGYIPSSLAGLHFLSWFSVANNNLTGEIPPGTQLQSFPPSSYLGNPGLCGFPLPSKCDLGTADKEHNNSEEEDGLEIPWFYVIVGFGYATGLLVIEDEASGNHGETKKKSYPRTALQLNMVPFQQNALQKCTFLKMTQSIRSHRPNRGYNFETVIDNPASMAQARTLNKLSSKAASNRKKEGSSV